MHLRPKLWTLVPTVLLVLSPLLFLLPSSVAWQSLGQSPQYSTRVFQQGLQGYQGAEDTFIEQYFQMRNHCTDDYVAVRQEDAAATLLRFDVSSLPRTAVVVSATLSLYVRSRSRPLPLDVALYPVVRDWEACQATWYEANADNSWTQAGCNDPYEDRSGTAVATGALDNQRCWFSYDVTEAVQHWVMVPEDNRGLIFKSFDTRWPVEYRFHSAEQMSAVELRPKLEVTYYVPTPTPTNTATATPTMTPTRTAIPTVTSGYCLLPIVQVQSGIGR